MKNHQDPKDKNEIVDGEKITNFNGKIVNNHPDTEHEPTNEESWVDDINEEFGEEPLYPDDEEDELY